MQYNFAAEYNIPQQVILSSNKDTFFKLSYIIVILHNMILYITLKFTMQVIVCCFQ